MEKDKLQLRSAALLFETPHGRAMVYVSAVGAVGAPELLDQPRGLQQEDRMEMLATALRVQDVFFTPTDGTDREVVGELRPTGKKQGAGAT